MTFPVLQDKVAIVTGAAQGMGEATARLFAEAGAKVVVADFNQDKGQSVVNDIVAAGGDAFFVKVDVSKGEDVKAICCSETFAGVKLVGHHGQGRCSRASDPDRDRRCNLEDNTRSWRRGRVAGAAAAKRGNSGNARRDGGHEPDRCVHLEPLAPI